MIAGVSAEATLVDLAFRSAVEGETHVFEIYDRIDCFFGENLGRILVNQVVAALHRVKSMPFPVIILDICQGSCHSTLSGSRV